MISHIKDYPSHKETAEVQKEVYNKPFPINLCSVKLAGRLEPLTTAIYASLEQTTKRIMTSTFNIATRSMNHESNLVLTNYKMQIYFGYFQPRIAMPLARPLSLCKHLSGMGWHA